MKRFNRWHFLMLLIGIMALMLVVHMILLTPSQGSHSESYWEFVSIFDMDSKNSLFLWYSVVVLLFIPSMLMLYIGWIKRQAKDKLSWGWLMAGFMFLFLSIDDGALIHQKFGAVNRLIGVQGVLDKINPNIFAWSWWVFYMAVFAVLVVFLMRWFVSLPKRTKIIIIIGIAIAITGQVFMEAISGYVTSSTGEYVGPVWRGLQKFTGRVGLSIFLFAIVDYILSTPLIRHRFMAILYPENTKKPSKD